MTEAELRQKIKEHPNYEKLLQAIKRHKKSLGGPFSMDRYEEQPEVVLTAHAGVWNRKSQRCQTMLRLARAIITDCKLPVNPPGKFRGDSETIDWSKIRS